jgi:hypothetical protein
VCFDRISAGDRGWQFWAWKAGLLRRDQVDELDDEDDDLDDGEADGDGPPPAASVRWGGRLFIGIRAESPACQARCRAIVAHARPAALARDGEIAGLFEQAGRPLGRTDWYDTLWPDRNLLSGRPTCRELAVPAGVLRASAR